MFTLVRSEIPNTGSGKAGWRSGLAVLAPLVLIACGGGGTGRPVPTATLSPTATPTRSATPIGTPTGAITYRLTEGSTIFIAPLTSGPAPTPVPLTGTFTVTHAEPQPPTPSTNEFFRFAITAVDFQAPSGVMVTSPAPGPYGCGGVGIGCIEAITLDPRVYATVTVSINGEQVSLGGAGPRPTSSGSPVFQDLEICGSAVDPSVDCAAIHHGASGFDLTVFASPEN